MAFHQFRRHIAGILLDGHREAAPHQTLETAIGAAQELSQTPPAAVTDDQLATVCPMLDTLPDAWDSRIETHLMAVAREQPTLIGPYLDTLVDHAHDGTLGVDTLAEILHAVSHADRDPVESHLRRILRIDPTTLDADTRTTFGRALAAVVEDSGRCPVATALRYRHHQHPRAALEWVGIIGQATPALSLWLLDRALRDVPVTDPHQYYRTALSALEDIVATHPTAVTDDCVDALCRLAAAPPGHRCTGPAIAVCRDGLEAAPQRFEPCLDPLLERARDWVGSDPQTVDGHPSVRQYVGVLATRALARAVCADSTCLTGSDRTTAVVLFDTAPEQVQRDRASLQIDRDTHPWADSKRWFERAHATLEAS